MRIICANLSLSQAAWAWVLYWWKFSINNTHENILLIYIYSIIHHFYQNIMLILFMNGDNNFERMQDI